MSDARMRIGLDDRIGNCQKKRTRPGRPRGGWISKGELPTRLAAGLRDARWLRRWQPNREQMQEVSNCDSRRVLSATANWPLRPASGRTTTIPTSYCHKLLTPRQAVGCARPGSSQENNHVI